MCICARAMIVLRKDQYHKTIPQATPNEQHTVSATSSKHLSEPAAKRETADLRNLAGNPF